MKRRTIEKIIIAVCAAVILATIAVVIYSKQNDETVEEMQIQRSEQQIQPESKQTTPPEAAQDVETEKMNVDTSSTPNQQTSTPKSAPTQQPTPKTSPKPAATCPAGSYRIGGTESEPVCKAEPTGCPYGDSIPVDSPKCAPPESWQL